MVAQASSEPETGSILQLKIRLLDISPMVWRRVLVSEDASLRELHGVLQTVRDISPDGKKLLAMMR